MTVLVVLDEVGHQVPDVEGPTPRHCWGRVSLKVGELDNETDKRKCAFIKGKSDVAA